MDYSLPLYNTTSLGHNKIPVQKASYIDQELSEKEISSYLQRNINSEWIAKRKLKNTRIIQKNAVYVIGIPKNIANPRILSSLNYFGIYGRVQSVDVNNKPYFDNENQTFLYSAYIRYSHNFEALLAIAALSSAHIKELPLLKASIGTTKFCQNYLFKNNCANVYCTYYHSEPPSDDVITNDQELSKGFLFNALSNIAFNSA